MMRLLKCERGGTLVEMALVSAMSLTMIIGIAEASFAVYTYHYMSEAAREGARYAIVRGSNCAGLPDCNATSDQISTYVKTLGYPGIDSTRNMTVTTTWYAASESLPTTWTACGYQCNSPGNAVRVMVTYNFPFMIPFVQRSTLAMKSSSQMVISN